MKKAVLIINPSSGGEQAKQYEEMAKTKLDEFFDEVRVEYTKQAGDATRFAAQACRDRVHSVFVMGGDGTVSEGLSGIAEQEYRPYFGFFPLGTVNDLARALGISLDPSSSIAEFDIEAHKAIDIGRINQKYFMNVVAMGTVPEAINSVESKDKTKWGAFAYFASAFKQLMNMQYHKFCLEIDGKMQNVESSTILIGLTNSIGGFEQILPNAEVDDGVLHLIYLKDSNVMDSVMAVPNLIGGIDESTNNIGYRTFRHAKISMQDPNAEPLTVNVDGDEGDSLPIEIGILPSHIDVYFGPNKA